MINSSLLKKGLAATAVSSLAITGLVVTGASFADSINNPATGVSLRSLVEGGTASTANDGTNTTISLVATGSTNVPQVQFSYNAGAGPVVIDTVARGVNSAFTTEWTPPAAINNLSVTISAQGQSTNGTNVGAADTKTVTLSSTAKAVELAPAGTPIGLYKADNGNYYGAVSGTVSAGTVGNVDLSTVAPTAGALGSATPADGKFSAVGNFGAYPFSTSTPAGPDEVVVKAQLPGANNTADAQAYAVYAQSVASIAAVPTPASVPTGGVSDIAVTVRDSRGAPVAGAKVYKTPAAPVLVGTTDALGQVHDLAPAGNYSYFVDGGTDVPDGVFTSGVDFQANASVGTYVPVATSATFVNAAGAAFDRDSYVAGDMKVKVLDQNGIALAGQNFFYSWTYTPFKPSLVDVAATIDGGFVTSGVDGTAALTFPVPANGAVGGTFVLNGYVNVQSNPGKDAGDPGISPAAVKAGESTVAWSDLTPAQRQAGTKQSFDGKVALQDGTTTLANQQLGVAWTPGTSAAVFAAQADQPAGTVRNGDTSASVTTSSTGSFTVVLNDPAAVPPAVQGNGGAGTLTATGNPAPTGPGADANAALGVQFLASTGISSVVADAPAPIIDNLITPGRPAQLDGIIVRNASGDTLANQSVTVSIDRGFIAETDPASTNPGDLVADPAPVAGANYGLWKSAGTTKTFRTNASGRIDDVALAIGRDSGFDDDGLVTATVTITAGNVSTTKPVTFTSATPLNLKSLAVTRSATQPQQLTALPRAAVDQGNEVNLAVRATDQFDNPTQVPVVVTSTGTGSVSFTGNSGFGSSIQTTATDNGTAGEQVIAVATNGVQGKSVWRNDGTPALPVWVRDTSGSAVVNGAGTGVTWYAVDYAASTYTLTHNTADRVPQGTAVTETYTARDQFNAPIFGMGVNFLRSGPDNNQSGNLSGIGVIDSTGKATYLFQGTTAGVANITAVLGDLNGLNVTNPIPASQRNDVVTFVAPVPPAIAISARLTVKNAPNGDDLLSVSTSARAAGATVTIFKVVRGKLQKVGTARLSSTGKVTNKRILDRTKAQKKAKSTYVVTIAKTARTKAATSNRVTIK